MSDRFFEDLQVGERFTTRSLTLSEGQMLDFALRFDPQPIHVDAVSAAAGPYGELIASGLHTLALACRLVQDTKPWSRAAMGSPGIEDLRWLRPVRPGDTLHVVTEVRHKRPSDSRPDRGIVMLHHEVFNQAGELVMRYTLPELVARRTPGTAAPAAAQAGR